jgi:hypothetical protein
LSRVTLSQRHSLLSRQRLWITIAIIHKDPKSDFGGGFPDFPGSITAGGTLEEAKEMGAEALIGTSRLSMRLPRRPAAQKVGRVHKWSLSYTSGELKGSEVTNCRMNDQSGSPSFVTGSLIVDDFIRSRAHLRP